MARITFKAGEDYMLRLEKTADRSAEMMEKALKEGARILKAEIRANLGKNLAGSEQSTGALAASLGVTPVDVDRDGIWNVKVGFHGYDEKGVPNQLKARVMESGSSTIQKRPFVRPAVIAKDKEVKEAMNRVINEEIEKTMNK